MTRRSLLAQWAGAGCVSCLLLAPVVLEAQSADARASIAVLRDSLASSADTNAMRALETRTIDSARANRDDAVLHLRLGFIALREAELTNQSGHFRDAQGEFEWATELQPAWPLGWYGLGVAELAEADGGSTVTRGIFTALGRDFYIAPARDLAHSAEVDSTFVRGVVDLTNEALRRGIPAHLSTALLALRQLGAAPAGRNPEVLLARGRIEREAGQTDSAIAAFRALIRRDPDNGVGQLELARTTLAAGRLSGADAWYRGVASTDSTAVAMYRFDLSLVMSDSMLHVFDTTRAADRVALVRHYWETRDPESLNSAAERLREHYRRIDVAHREFALVAPADRLAGRRYDTLPTYTVTGARFDDRGRVYVRHGPPDARSTLELIGLPPNETWAYHLPSGDLLFNFAQPDSAAGYRLYESLLDIAGLGAAAQNTGQGNVRARLETGHELVTYGAAWTAQVVEELLYSRAKLSPLYRDLLGAPPAAVRGMETAEREAGRKALAVGLQTDSWKFGYELPLTGDVDVAAVGADDRGPQLQVTFAIPGSALYAPPAPGTVVYAIRMRVAVRDASGALVATVDTLRNFGAPAPLGDGDHLLGRLPVDVPAGDYTVRVALETESRGFVTGPRSVHVASMAPATIALSDLALGARSVPLPWRTGPADTAWINPLHLFKSTEPMELFFEVEGVAASTPYRAELAILRAGHPEPLQQFSFNPVAATDPDRVHREIDIHHLGGGNYILRMTVSMPNGAKAIRQRPFTVVR